MRIQLSVKEQRTLLNKLKKVFNQSSEQATLKTALLIQQTAKELVPVQTGTLQDSIEIETLKVGPYIQTSVFTKCYYAPYVEFGTGIRGAISNGELKYPMSSSGYNYWTQGMEAQPFLWPAYKLHEKQLKRITQLEIQTLLRSLNSCYL